MPYNIPSIFNVSSIEPTTIQNIIDRLKSKEMLDRILPIRNAKTKEDADAIKRGLPAFALCKVSDRVDSEGFISTKHIIYDIDNLGVKTDGGSMITAEDVIDRVKPFALFSFVSPSGKGIKFVIELDREVNLNEYRYNRNYYRDILSAEIGLPLDNSYNAYHTFYSYTKTVEINVSPFVFAAITPDVAAQTNDVNPDTIIKGEILDIRDYLSEKKLDYHDWTTVCFALQGHPNGREVFKHITEGDKSTDHAHRKWESKWKNCANPSDITIRSLYHVAFKHGYIRKDKYIEEGRGKYLPFLIKEDGMYHKTKDKIATRIFGFTNITIKYHIYDPVDGNKVCLIVNGTEITLKTTVFSSAMEFRKAIQSYAKCSPFMITSSKSTLFYDMLFDYMDKTKDNLSVKSLHGCGLVSPEDRMWNFGSVVCVKGKVLPYDPLIVYDGVGYALDDMRSKMAIKDVPPLLKRKLGLLHDVYTEYAATAIGWAVSNIFYPQIMHEHACFPIMFLFGKTASGKTKLATIILAMFGIKNPEKAGDFRVSLTSATQTAMARIKHGSVGIPHFFDEYRAGKKEHYEMLKNFYEGAGKAMGKKTNDAQIHRMEIGSGSIFAAVNKDVEAEAVNRCIYVDMNGIKPDDKGAESSFQKEFISERGLSDLSAFILHIVCEKTWIQWLTEYNRLREYIDEALWNENVIVDSRIQVNYAIVGAGYNLCKGLFAKHVPDDWWVMQAKITSTYAEESDPIEKFLSYIYRFAVSGRFPHFIFMQEGDTDEEHILLFHVGSALTEVRLIERLLDDLITLSAAEMTKRLKAHKDFLGDSSHVFISQDGITRKTIRIVKMRYKEK